MKKTFLLFFVALLIQGCFSGEEDYEYGYDDGYAAGYNTTCNIRATMIKGDWDNKNYSNGYRDGYADGSFACRNKE